MRIYSIFPSIDGEVNAYHQGVLTTFIRVAGCNICCNYCDTLYALSMQSGRKMSVKEVMQEVGAIGLKKVTITGGEPLLQLEAFQELTKLLYRENYFVSVETNGTFPCKGYGVGSWVVDYKLESSGCSEQMTNSAFVNLRANDFVKFVIGDRVDFEQALAVKKYYQSTMGLSCKFAFSPSHGLVTPNQLIDWLMLDKVFDAIVNLQLHKFVNLEESK